MVDKMKKMQVNTTLFGTLIHSCPFKKQPPALGQISIGRVGQYSTGANRLGDKICQPTLKNG
jgi:hypothetical protein